MMRDKLIVLLPPSLRRRELASLGRFRCVVVALLITCYALAGSSARAQTNKRQTSRAAQGGKRQAATKDKKAVGKNGAEQKPQPKDELSALRDQFVEKTGEYKKSLEKLQTYYEKNVGKAESDLAKLRGLYEEGLISKKAVTDSEQALAAAKAKVSETQQLMKAADSQIADALVEEKAVEQEAKAPPPARGKMIRTTAYIRYSGTGSFSLSSGAGRVMSFYTQTFRRQLPISAFGQTAVHNQLGFDHRNAMDVALNPNSREGQALVAYLQANGIPFFAFYMAIPGSATGPHIHVGLPSHKIR